MLILINVFESINNVWTVAKYFYFYPFNWWKQYLFNPFWPEFLKKNSDNASNFIIYYLYYIRIRSPGSWRIKCGHKNLTPTVHWLRTALIKIIIVLCTIVYRVLCVGIVYSNIKTWITFIQLPKAHKLKPFVRKNKILPQAIDKEFLRYVVPAIGVLKG